MRYTITFLTIFLCESLLTSSLWAQTCQTKDIEESTPTSRFTFGDNGLVTDKETGITWTRCALGQKWDGTTCSGKANTYDWQNLYLKAT